MAGKWVCPACIVAGLGTAVALSVMHFVAGGAVGTYLVWVGVAAAAALTAAGLWCVMSNGYRVSHMSRPAVQARGTYRFRGHGER